MPRAKAVSVQVIAYAPTVFTHCQHCELTFQQVGIGERLRRVEATASLPEDLGREFQALSDWVHRLVGRHGARVHVRIVDAASIEGFLRSLRYGVRRYPAVIVDGRETRTGADLEASDPVIDRRVAEAAGAGSGVGV